MWDVVARDSATALQRLCGGSARRADPSQTRHRTVANWGFPRHTGAPTVPSVSSDPRHQLGSRGEQFALEHLARRGCRLVARNHRTRFGEIDLIVRDGRTLVFVEVKTRRARRAGAVWDALDERKRAQVRRMARSYLHDAAGRPRALEIRFDAIGVVLDARGDLVRLDHLEAAF